VLFVLFRHWLPTVYVHEAQVIAIAANLLLVAAVFQLVDGLQVVALGALRGIADATVPTYIAFAAYALVALPTSYVCAFVLGWRETGIWIGYLAGLSVASTLFVVRFSRRSRVMTMEQTTIAHG
jgi:MATE family multidrug resistance protein